MAKADTKKLKVVGGREKEWEMWQYLKAVVEFKRGRIKATEASHRMSYWSGIDPDICFMMLDGLRRESTLQFIKAKPKLKKFSSLFPDKL
jgi:hypothetical protein